ncbi:hypothetical protein [Phenylobacterium sp.]|jgi:hypothetical protein|uniref:hypothetical protein n=1 Tax=Phenylobacterium sp. TaxID=1871053 RepID=UPI002F927FCD
MIALLMAAAVSSAAADLPVRISPRMIARSQLNCGLWNAEPVNRRGPNPPRVQSLGELPPADQELTVLRMGPDGCSQAVVVRRNVQGDGRFPAPRR